MMDMPLAVIATPPGIIGVAVKLDVLRNLAA
jgi:hypothetical protein